MNRALRKVLAQYGYKDAPYPTSYALMNALREETPPDKQYLLQELFYDITLFSNRGLTATAHRRPDGKYDVTVDVETHKYKADEKGNELKFRSMTRSGVGEARRCRRKARSTATCSTVSAST